ncbi:hypothetical protein [Brucella anthropi]|uniref:hypothetical protein n=1 Tax=Brucella anthropi TaxID=529 RepID=UPI0024475395|nr:hypothetical protein [Brucella anthropi]MDH0368643.1 hypothetical protein [Brucella anthropi]
MPKNYRELNDDAMLWDSVTNLEIDPDYSQTLYSNGYNMVRVDVWFTPTYSNGPGNAPIPASAPQDILNSATRLIDYDTGAEIPFLTTPPTPDHPVSSPEFQNFKSWAQTQTANDFITLGTGASSRQIDDSSQSCVTFYILCNMANPNRNPLTLGVQIQPTDGDLLKYYRNGLSNLGSNGPKEIMAQPPRVYGAGDFSCTLEHKYHDGETDSFSTTPPTNYPDFAPQIWRQYNFGITLNTGTSVIYRISPNVPTQTIALNYPSGFVPYASKSKNGYNTTAYIWPDNADAQQGITIPGYTDYLYIDITVKNPNTIRGTLIFSPSLVRDDSRNFTDYTYDYIITAYDLSGNSGAFSPSVALPSYTDLAAPPPNTPTWTAIASPSSTPGAINTHYRKGSMSMKTPAGLYACLQLSGNQPTKNIIVKDNIIGNPNTSSWYFYTYNSLSFYVNNVQTDQYMSETESQYTPYGKSSPIVPSLTLTFYSVDIQYNWQQSILYSFLPIWSSQAFAIYNQEEAPYLTVDMSQAISDENSGYYNVYLGAYSSSGMDPQKGTAVWFISDT